NATRRHLDALVADGMAMVDRIPSTGPGRPAQGWTLTREGRRAVAGDSSAAAHAELIDAVAASLSASPDAAEEARSIGLSWGARHRQAGASMEGVLTQLGFSPEHDAERRDTTRLLTCPILDAAQANPDVICGIHRGLIEGLTDRTDGVQLLPFAEPGACIVRVRPTA
ncbi:MAG: hypothetical protein Q4G40_12605, partial [Brachybacterium sp.]|nr:hypothetical protein [Brachybacterium sp.]